MIPERMQELYHLRQQDIAPVEQMKRLPVHVIGTGAIGSFFCLQGAKVGFELTAYDPDIVGPENVSSQVYGPEHLGVPKVLAIQDICRRLAGAEISTVQSKVAGGEALTGVVVEAVDSMRARSSIWDGAIVPRAPFIELYISVRMGAETGSLIVVRPSSVDDRIWYEANSLYGDDQALQLPCSGRAISYCASIGASLAVMVTKACLMEADTTFRRVEFDLTNLMWCIEE